MDFKGRIFVSFYFKITKVALGLEFLCIWGSISINLFLFGIRIFS